jgi:hypothetical protein
MEDNFTESALIGHLLSFGLITKLASRGLISRADAVEMFDDALLQLEEHQALFPEHVASFERARDFLSGARDGFPTISQTPPWQTP